MRNSRATSLRAVTAAPSAPEGWRRKAVDANAEAPAEANASEPRDAWPFDAEPAPSPAPAPSPSPMTGKRVGEGASGHGSQERRVSRSGASPSPASAPSPAPPAPSDACDAPATPRGIREPASPIVKAVEAHSAYDYEAKPFVRVTREAVMPPLPSHLCQHP